MVEPAQLLHHISSASSVRHWVENEVFDKTPWIFKGDATVFEEWRKRVADAGGVDSGSIYLVGSAATGYSLSPYKPGRKFRLPGITGTRPSDIDIAIVDNDLFVDLWDVMLTYDRKRRLTEVLAVSGPLRGDELERVRQNVYWGAIANNCAPAGTLPSRRLLFAFSAASRKSPFLGHPPKARVYRRKEDLLAYHEQSVLELVRTLESEGY